MYLSEQYTWLLTREEHKHIVQRITLAEVKRESGDNSFTRVKPGYYVFKTHTGNIYHIRRVKGSWWIHKNTEDNTFNPSPKFIIKTLTQVKQRLDVKFGKFGSRI